MTESLHRLAPYGFVGIFLGCVGLFMVLFFAVEKIAAPGPMSESHFFVIQKGKSTAAIAQDLYQEGIIDSPQIFKFLVRLSQKKIKAGEYKFLPHLSLGQVATLVDEGKLVTHRVTIPEGLTSSEIVQLLRNNPLLEGVIPDIPQEGTLFPTTFSIHRGQDRLSLLNRMASLMTQARTTLDKSVAPNNLLSSYERLILASIIEKETYNPDERAPISGVFHNRLKKKMPLQADPCVIYALTQGRSSLNRPLNRKDLSVESPYNTYLVQGLPPTPICNPGQAALQAAYHPLGSSNLYFVAKEDGTHHFSKDYTSHAHYHQKLRNHRAKKRATR